MRAEVGDEAGAILKGLGPLLAGCTLGLVCVGGSSSGETSARKITERHPERNKPKPQTKESQRSCRSVTNAYSFAAYFGFVALWLWVLGISWVFFLATLTAVSLSQLRL